MKSFSFSSIPEITSDIVRKTKFSITSFTASYRNNNEDYPLGTEVDNVMAFVDNYAVWSVEELGFDINIKGEFKQLDFLYSDQGVVRPGDELGIAFRISSSDSRQRFIFGFYPYSIDQSTKSLQFNCSINIPPGKLRIKALLEMILYVKSSIIGTVPGTVVGVVYSQILSFSGDGTQFPITTLSSDEPFLWKLEVDYEDLHVDSFAECVNIIINTKHPYYPQLLFDKDPMNSGLFIDIMTNAIIYFIQKMKEDECFIDVENDNSLEDGSIGAAARDIIQTYAIHHDDLLKLSEDIQKYVSGKMDGD